MWPLKTILYFSLFWAGCLAALLNPIWGVVTYIMVYQTNPADKWWGIPLTDLGMRFSMLAASFTVAGIVLARKHVPKVRPAFTEWFDVCSF